MQAGNLSAFLSVCFFVPWVGAGLFLIGMVMDGSKRFPSLRLFSCGGAFFHQHSSTNQQEFGISMMSISPLYIFFLPQIRTEVLDGGIDRLVRGRAVKTAGLRGSLQLAKP